MDSHARQLTYPAVVELLQDGEWHANDELAAVAFFPREWLDELERDGLELERRGESPEMVRLVA
jgi:hypothetical protein